MASNVFGNPVTDATLQAMPDYIGKEITATDRAHVALNMKNAENKAENARAFVENLKKRYGNGVSTLCLIYNATGGNLIFAGHRDWWGRIGESPYPNRLENGQWGAYLHVKTSGAATGSIAACVYRGENANGIARDWMLAWYNPWGRVFDNNRVSVT